MVNASSILIFAKDDQGDVGVSVIDIGSTSGVNVAALAERVAANLTADELKRMSAGLGAAESANDLSANAAAAPRVAMHASQSCACMYRTRKSWMLRWSACLYGESRTNDLFRTTFHFPPFLPRTGTITTPRAGLGEQGKVYIFCVLSPATVKEYIL